MYLVALNRGDRLPYFDLVGAEKATYNCNNDTLYTLIEDTQGLGDEQKKGGDPVDALRLLIPGDVFYYRSIPGAPEGYHVGMVSSCNNSSANVKDVALIESTVGGGEASGDFGQVRNSRVLFNYIESNKIMTVGRIRILE